MAEERVRQRLHVTSARRGRGLVRRAPVDHEAMWHIARLRIHVARNEDGGAARGGGACLVNGTRLNKQSDPEKYMVREFAQINWEKKRDDFTETPL